jgi:hypothetical protein
MSSIIANAQGPVANVASLGTGLLKGQGLLSEITGEPGRVQFLNASGTILSFDACMQEMHSRETVPTVFPLEDGGTITDHIVITPFELTLTGVVSDTPLDTREALLTELIGTAASAVLPPLGVVVGAQAYSLIKNTSGKKRRSLDAYNKLVALQGGKPMANPAQPPAIFTVRTRYARYPNMVIRGLQFPRDPTTGDSCLFTVTLAELRLVQPQSVQIRVLANKALGAARAELGEQEAKQRNGGLDGYNASQRDIKTVGDKSSAALNTVKSALGRVF